MNQTWLPLIIHRLYSRSGFTVTVISSSIAFSVQLLAGSTRHRCDPVAVASFLSLFLQLAQIIASLDPDSLKERCPRGYVTGGIRVFPGNSFTFCYLGEASYGNMTQPTSPGLFSRA